MDKTTVLIKWDFSNFDNARSGISVKFIFATIQTTQVPTDFSLDFWSIFWPGLQPVLSPDGSPDLAICDYAYLLLLLPLLASRQLL